MTPRVLVIADDFTGAAEIAGIGSRFGLDPEITRQPPFESISQMLVIDTDSRSLVPAEAAGRVRGTLNGIRTTEYDLIFKKIDSVLRGPVLAEIEAAQRALNRPAAILAPANPSRGRSIENGEYFIHGIPLHQTDLANDPEHPRDSSRIADLVGTIPNPIALADASSQSDVLRIAQGIDARTLPVGAADFFTALLTLRGLKPRAPSASPALGRTLLVCGTTAESSRSRIAQATSRGVRVLIPSDDPALVGDGHVILTTGPIAPAQDTILPHLARWVAHLLERTTFEDLLIEGGATSSAILQQMHWTRFHDCVELAPGIVRMSVTGHPIQITVKPGSYRWPDEVWQVVEG